MVSQSSGFASHMQSIAAQASSAFGSMGSSIASHVGNMVSSVGRGVASIGSNIIGAIEGVGRFAFFARQAAEGAMGLAQALFGQDAALEQSRVAFVGLLGSGQAADAMLRRLQSFAAATPFEFPELVHDTQMLLGMGFAARDVIPVLTAVGDTAAGIGRGKESIQAITLALGQMQARGKVTGQDMLQMTEAGVPAWKILAQAMHLTVAQVEDLSQQGKLGADSVTLLWQGMERMYPKAMLGQATTFNGLLSTLKDNAGMAWQAISGPAFKMAENALSQLTNLLGSPVFRTFAATIGQQVGGAIASIVTWVKQAVSWFGQFAPQVAQVGAAFNNLAVALAPTAARMQQANTAGNMLNGALGALRLIIVGTATVISALALGLAAVIRWVQAGGPVIQMLGSIFNQLASVISSSFLPVWKQMQDSWRQLQPAIAPLLPALKVIGEILLGVVVVAILTVIAILAGLIAAFARVLIGVMQFVTGIVQFFSGMAQACSGAINFITDLVTGKFSRLGADLQEIWQGIALMFAGMWNMIQGIFNAAVGSVIALISTFIGTITSLFTGLYQALVGGSIIPDMCNAIVSAFTGMISSVLSLVSGFISSAISLFVSLGANATMAVLNAANQIIGAFNNLRSQALGTLQSLVSGAAGILNQLAGIAARAGSAMISALVGQINAGIGWVSGAINNVVAAIGNVLPHSPAKEGPLRDLDKYGPAITGGLAAGIMRGLPAVQTAVNMMIQPIPTAVTGRIDASATGVAVAASRTRSAAVDAGNQTFILRVDGHDLARAMGPFLASEVRLHVIGGV